MKKIVKLFIVGVLIFGGTSTAAINYNAIEATFPILINGIKWTTDKPVVVIDGSTYLPLRAMAEALNIGIKWNESQNQVEVGESNTQKIYPSRLINNMDTDELLSDGDAIYQDLKTEYMATSTYSRENTSYEADNLGSIWTDECWVEGAKGNGIGQKIICRMIDYCEKLEDKLHPEWNAGNATILLDEVGIALEKWLLDTKKSGDVPKHEYAFATKETLDKFYNKLDGFYIINGYAKDDTLWKNNNRVKTLKLTIDGKKEYILELEDSKALQVFDISYINADITVPITAEFEILDVYKGDKFDDTVLTTLKPFGGSNIRWGGR